MVGRAAKQGCLALPRTMNSKGNRKPDESWGRSILGCQVTALRASAIRGSAFRPSAIGYLVQVFGFRCRCGVVNL